MSELPRLKPDPIPAIHPVPEYAATGDLAEAYKWTREGLGVPWMGVVAMAFAHYPRFYETLWSALKPLVGSDAFTRACHDLREQAEQEAVALSPPSISGRLGEIGYDQREIEEIRACNEVFSAGNMPYLLMASLARLVLEGGKWPVGTVAGRTPEQGPDAPRPVLIEPHHADATMSALYADIRGTLGLPFVNTDYRAFARWPSYFAPAWADLKRAVVRDDYEHHVARVHDRAVALAAGLPNPTGLSSDALREAAAADATSEDVLAVVRLFQWLLPGLALNVAFLREQLIDHRVLEQIAR
ncbi:hypothetical protein J7443_00420 [Tropicibacter sp. R15_0]|uniref:halocarboxylic acid dehydrogenase DehI family protein n=1 Tax=Tropicibacter sp. R15_0 TaxID=2821101 RepID=UPI001ADB7195|nr:halocarboxylic acid dehydrogenase DehI family protein [Tropicibacter sp. R15_0]MBO9463680.1 hypothetical protein [Tropicibacter sp. R15_0]